MSSSLMVSLKSIDFETKLRYNYEQIQILILSKYEMRNPLRRA